MSDADASHDGATDGSEAGTDESPVAAAMDEAVGNTVLPRYLLVGGAVAVAWWQVVGGLSAYVAALGAVGLVMALPSLVGVLRARRWPTVEAVVVESMVLTKDEALSLVGGGAHTGSEGGYVPLVRYEYEVDGDRFVSARYSFGGWPGLSSQEKAEEWLEDYPAGSEVTVHYSPDRPDTTVLEPGGSGALFAVLFGLLWIGLGAFLVLRPDLWTSALPS